MLTSDERRRQLTQAVTKLQWRVDSPYLVISLAEFINLFEGETQTCLRGAASGLDSKDAFFRKDGATVVIDSMALIRHMQDDLSARLDYAQRLAATLFGDAGTAFIDEVRTGLGDAAHVLGAIPPRVLIVDLGRTRLKVEEAS